MITTSRLELALPVPSDFQRYFEIYSDPETNLFNPMGPMDEKVATKVFEETLAHWKLHSFGSWAIRAAGNEQVIGFGGLAYRFYGKDVRLNLGYRFETSAWGKGYATEFALAAINHGFTILGVPEIYALVRPSHNASIRVLEKAGMQLAGTLDDVKGQDESLVFRIKRGA